MTNNYNVTETTHSDIESLFAADYLCFGNKAHSKEYLASCLNNNLRKIFVIKDNDDVIAFITLQFFCGEAEIFNIGTVPSHRKKGCASLLLDYTEDFLKTQSIEKIFLEVRVSNIAAQRLYTSHGYETIATRKNYYTLPSEDALIMQKEI